MTPEALDSRRNSVLQLRDFLLKFARAPATELEQGLRRELEQLVGFATETSVWWRHRLEDAEPGLERAASLEAALNMLPTCAPQLLQECFEEMLVDVPGSTDDDYVVHRTSGSTGQPRGVRKHQPSHSLTQDALLLVDWAWTNRDPGKPMAFFLAVVEDADATPMSPPVTYLGKTAPAYVRRSLDRPVEELLDVLALHRPSYVVSSATTARLLARLQLAQDRPPVRLEQMLTFTDRVDPDLRALAREAFGARIVDRYSTQEVGYVALQCPVHDHLHVVPGVCVEIIDESGAPCPVGVPGRVLLTALHSFAMPIIRHEVGDVATWGRACDSGITWPVIQSIQGRTRDVYRAPDGSERLVGVMSSAFTLRPDILDYQVVTFDDTILVVTRVVGDPDPATERGVTIDLQQIFGTELPVRFLYTHHLDWEGSWKRREFYPLVGACPRDPEFEDIQRRIAAAHAVT